MGSPSREIRRVFAGGHSDRAHQDDKHADAPRPRPRRLFVPHGWLPNPSQCVQSIGRPPDRQYKDIILQAPPSEYDRVRQAHLERRGFGLANICRMMATIYADNLSRSVSSKGIAGRGAAMQAVDRDCTSVLPGMSLLPPIWAFKKKVFTRNQTPAAAAAAARSASSATMARSLSVKTVRTAAKQRERRRRPCVVFISQDNVPQRRRL